MELEGLVSWGSNYIFLAQVCGEERDLMAVYKPRKGERPLWDFAPGTLCLRERAAYVVSDALGWGLVPPTVLRDGPHGWGSVQLFIDHDPNQHYFTFQNNDKYIDSLQRIVLFDLVANNADRKGGHILVDDSDRLWSIDHGICFHSDYKLRSVIWDFAGMTVPEPLLNDLQQFLEKLEGSDQSLVQQLDELLNERERSALRRRVKKLLQRPHFPQPGPGRHYPWPPV